MLNRQIFLIGMPGCGKSSIGRKAARELGITFLDLDEWIEERAGMKVPEIFEQYGEEGFRRMETGALTWLSRIPPCIISTGGGTPMTPVNRKIMKNFGSVILLDRPEEQILGDLRPENRPLLQESPEENFRRLYRERMPVYRQLADVTVRNDGEYQQTVALLMRALNDRYHA